MSDSSSVVREPEVDWSSVFTGIHGVSVNIRTIASDVSSQHRLFPGPTSVKDTNHS